MTTKESKRILSVTTKRTIDESPDTSWLGEYSSTKTSEFSIDRAHSEDCSSVTSGALVDQLERAIGYLNTGHLVKDIEEWEPIRDAQDILTAAQEELAECDCNESGDMNRGEYRYFNPSSNYVDSNDKLVDGNTPEEVRKYVRQDYERVESMNRGNWGFIGISAEARVQTNGMSAIQTIRSGGLWGIETDSDAGYFQEVETEELAALKSELTAIGFSKRAIATAFRNVKHEEF